MQTYLLVKSTAIDVDSRSRCHVHDHLGSSGRYTGAVVERTSLVLQRDQLLNYSVRMTAQRDTAVRQRRYQLAATLQTELEQVPTNILALEQSIDALSTQGAWPIPFCDCADPCTLD